MSTTYRIPSTVERRVSRQNGLTLDQALAWATDQGALYVHHRGDAEHPIIFVFRPAPAFPGCYGQSVIIGHEDGYTVGEPWILIDRFPSWYVDRLR